MVTLLENVLTMNPNCKLSVISTTDSQTGTSSSGSSPPFRPHSPGSGASVNTTETGWAIFNIRQLLGCWSKTNFTAWEGAKFNFFLNIVEARFSSGKLDMSWEAVAPVTQPQSLWQHLLWWDAAPFVLTTTFILLTFSFTMFVKRVLFWFLLCESSV